MCSRLCFTATCGILLSALSSKDLPVQARRLAVLDLDDGQVRLPAKEIFGRDLDIGHGVRSLLVDYLQQNGFTIVEWKALDEELTARGLPPGKRSDPAGSKRAAHVIAAAVDGLVLGSIRQLGRDTKTGVKAIGPSGEAVPFKSVDECVAQIELRVMDAGTGDVVAAIEGSGSAAGSGSSLFRPKGGGRMSGQGVDFSSPEFAKSMPGEAITEAVAEAGARLAQAQWVREEKAKEAGPASELLAVMLINEIEKSRNKGFDDDLAIQPSSADLSVGRTVFVQPMTYDFHVEVAQALKKAKSPPFVVVDDSRTADLWIRGQAGYSGALKIFGAELSIVPRGTETVLWSGKAKAGGYDPNRETESFSLAKKLVHQMQKNLGLPEK
jgi:curli biogenesis system outer membrane secretion channel CsgG